MSSSSLLCSPTFNSNLNTIHYHPICVWGCGCSSQTSMEFDNNTNNNLWDLHNTNPFGMLNSDIMSTMVMESGSIGKSTTPIFPPVNRDLSSGYLQDALVVLRNQCERRRLFSDEQQEEENYENCWNWNITDCSENSNCLSQMYNTNIFADEPLNSSLSSSTSDGELFFPETKVPEDYSISASEMFDYASLQKGTFRTECSNEFDNMIARNPLSSSDGSCGGKQQTKLIKIKVVYPFQVVKPGGLEGDVTLNDINKRILMRPTRPVRHPVGDFACRPCVSPYGTGISGKPVVAFTKIQTQGRGTITIVRTSG